jgi:hypothetical protein
MITGVAIRWGPYMIVLPKPARHADVLDVAREWMRRDSERTEVFNPHGPPRFAEAFRERPSGEQGFVDDRHDFLTREEAASMALECGQVTALRFQPEKLFSEDVW